MNFLRRLRVNPTECPWPLGLRLVLVEKVVSALGMVVLASFTAFLLARGIHDPIRFLVRGELREDPNDRIALWLLAHSPVIPNWGLESLEAIWWAWAILLSVEAVGLAFRKGWAEWLVLVETAAFIPFEAIEMARRASAFRGAALAINVAILVYLAWRQVDDQVRAA